MMITTNSLRLLGACPKGVRWFKEQFPSGKVEVNAGLRKAWEDQLGRAYATWLLRRLKHMRYEPTYCKKLRLPPGAEVDDLLFVGDVVAEGDLTVHNQLFVVGSLKVAGHLKAQHVSVSVGHADLKGDVTATTFYVKEASVGGHLHAIFADVETWLECGSLSVTGVEAEILITNAGDVKCESMLHVSNEVVVHGSLTAGEVVCLHGSIMVHEDIVVSGPLVSGHLVTCRRLRHSRKYPPVVGALRHVDERRVEKLSRARKAGARG